MREQHTEGDTAEYLCGRRERLVNNLETEILENGDWPQRLSAKCIINQIGFQTALPNANVITETENAKVRIAE